MRAAGAARVAAGWRLAALLVLACGGVAGATGVAADGGATSTTSTTSETSATHVALPPIVDDSAVQRAVETARTRFLARQTFTRFDVTVLLADRAGRWRRGAHGGGEYAYPASCVKLGYLIGAVHWCAALGRAPDCLDADVRPMIELSDNVATGRVVDAITGAPNAESADDAGFATWVEQRRYTERVLEGYGLLAGQRLLNKTYPSNSGDEPAGLEQRSVASNGRNRMSPDGAARLMLALETGALEPQARAYAAALLTRARFGAQSAFGGGLPPGSRYRAKIGNAYDTLEEIAYAELPDGRRLVIAAFSNGWDPQDPQPYDLATLGSYVEELLRALPSARRADAARYLSAAQARRSGAWTVEHPRAAWHARAGVRVAQAQTQTQTQTQGASSTQTMDTRDAAGAALEWRVRVPAPGRYEVAAWHVAGAANTAAASYHVAVPRAATPPATTTLDQRVWNARWLPIAEVDVAGRAFTVRLTADAPGRLVADTLRIARIPDTPTR